MKKIQVGNMVKVVGGEWNRHFKDKRGELVGIVKEEDRKEYIVQFSQPFRWSWFLRQNLRWDE